MFGINFCLLLLLVGLLSRPSFAVAVTLEDLDPNREWRLKEFTIRGNEQFTDAQLRSELVTNTRPWYALWRSRSFFDQGNFNTDIERLRRFYIAHGYYDARVSYELETDPADQLITATVLIHEGAPVQVSEVTFTVTDQPALTASIQDLRATLPIAEGKIFTEEDYQQTEAKLKEFFLNQHYGRVTVARATRILVDQHAAQVHYTITTGPVTVFGDTQVEGAQTIDPALVSRELQYHAGEPFSAQAITTSRERLLKLDLFSAVRFLQEESPRDPSVIPMRVQVDEKPFREWRFSIGYGTEDQMRGQIRWRHNNWFGGGRRLDVQVKASALTRQIDVSFLQPYFLGSRNRFLLTFRPQQMDEPGYFLNMTRLQPRFERDFGERLTGFLAYRLEYDRLNNINPATIRLLRGFERKGALSGLSVGLNWNTTDDPLNSTRGGLFSFSAEHVGGALGGDFHFWKLQGEARKYQRLSEKIVLATRFRLGFADPLGGSDEIPLFERFFAGGANSVRGYGRHRLGPLSTADDPVGGRSLLEGSLELRRSLFEKIGGVVFLDFGQVSLRSFDVPIDDLRFALGFGGSYVTPVGPLRLDIGFPLDPPRGDQPWQIHFSIGQFF